MMFSAGMGIGLMFYGVAEPLAHFTEPPPGTVAGGSTEALDVAIVDLDAPDATWLFVLRSFWPYRTLELDGSLVEAVPAQLQHLRLTPAYEDEGAPGVADVQRLVVLVEDKNGGVHGRALHL